MTEPHIFFLQYKELELHPIQHDRHGWLLTQKETCEAFAIDDATLDTLLSSHADSLLEDRHFLKTSITSAEMATSKITFWTKKGVIRLAYYLKSEASLDFLDLAEDLEPTTRKRDDGHLSHFYDEVEETLLQKLDQLKSDEESSLEDLNKLIYTINNLAQKRTALQEGPKKEPTALESILSAVSKMVNVDQSTLKDTQENPIAKAVMSHIESDAKTKERLEKMPKLDF